jgi:hypothetical protein
MDGNHEQELEDLELFQKHVTDCFSEVLSSTSDDDPSSPSTGFASSSTCFSVARPSSRAFY